MSIDEYALLEACKALEDKLQWQYQQNYSLYQSCLALKKVLKKLLRFIVTEHALLKSVNNEFESTLSHYAKLNLKGQLFKSFSEFRAFVNDYKEQLQQLSLAYGIVSLDEDYQGEMPAPAARSFLDLPTKYRLKSQFHEPHPVPNLSRLHGPALQSAHEFLQRKLDKLISANIRLRHHLIHMNFKKLELLEQDVNRYQFLHNTAFQLHQFLNLMHGEQHMAHFVHAITLVRERIQHKLEQALLMEQEVLREAQVAEHQQTENVEEQYYHSPSLTLTPYPSHFYGRHK